MVVDNLKTLTLFHHYQHAYRGGRSTDTKLYHWITSIGGAMDEKILFISASLDIEEIFYNILYNAVYVKLGEP